MWNQSDSNDSLKMNVSIPSSVEQTETNNLVVVERQIIDNKSSLTTAASNSSSSSGGGVGVGRDNVDNINHDKFLKTDLIASASGGIDSGFLSGPQLESCEIDFDGDDEEDHVKESDINIATTPVVAVTIQPSLPADIGTTDTGYIDSGCIDEEEEDADHQHFTQKPNTTTSTAAFTNRVNKGTETEQMILDNSIDSGLTDWFCNLSLKSNQTVNNLGSSNNNTSDAKKFINNIKGTTTTTNASNQNCSSSSSNITATTINNKWEIYYQQNNDGDTQLHLACITGYLNVIAALIRMAPHPCFLDIQNDEAQSALHIATLTAQPLVIRMLLVAGAEPTLRDRNGNTPLHLACISGDSQCVRALTIPISTSELQEAQRFTTSSATTTSPLSATPSTKTNVIDNSNCNRTQQYFPCAQLPTDLEIRNYDGERCVHLAAQGCHIEVLRHLVWFGADINAREGKSGRTPLHIAVEQCNEVLANFLLEECQQKINLETVTYSGLTPYQFACIVQNHKIQNDLEKFGAEPLTPPDSDTDGSDIESELDDSQIYDNFGDPGYFIQSHTLNLSYRCRLK